MQGLLAFIMTALLAAQSGTTGSVVGRVVEEGTGAPIPGARITAFMAGPRAPGSPPQSFDAESDSQGRFTLSGLLPGRYMLNIQKNGFASQSGPGGPAPQPINVVAGQSTEVERVVQRAAVIAGHVMDPNGEPLAEARVMAMRRMPNSDRLFPGGGSSQTNDLGEFRLFNLAPGEYVVQAVPRPEGSYGPGPGTPKTTIVAPTFYPGVAESSGAQSILVSSGQVADGITIGLVTVPAFRLSGIVVDETGAPVEGAMIWVMQPSGPGAIPAMGPPARIRSERDGRFMVPNVQGGTYQIGAAFPVVVSAPAGSGAIGAGSSGFSFSSSVGGGSVGGVSGPISSETRNGVTTQFRMNNEDRILVDVRADVSGLRLVARRPN
ncbi:MAG TPA: carboxypeptidase-like regulatory domain-containing protein [Vicinamibacterales bacterium]